MEDESIFTKNQPKEISKGLQNFIDSMVEEIVLDKMYPKPSEEELLADMLDHFDCEHPRYAGIIRGKLQNKSNDEIFKKHKLGKSRGYQEVENTYYAAYTFLMCRNCS